MVLVWCDHQKGGKWQFAAVNINGGYVTSSGLGRHSRYMLAAAWVEAVVLSLGSEVEVQILMHLYRATVVADPVFDLENRRLLG